MNKLIKLAVLILGTIASSNVLASKVKCEPAKFERIYTDKGNYFIQLEGMPWKIKGVRA